MYELKKIRKSDIFQLIKAASILYACGRDMAQRLDLHHWDNPYIKTLAIVILRGMKNDVYLLYDKSKPAAVFMTRKEREALHFEKLGTLPEKSGKGIGSFCMREIEKTARSMGCTRIIMEVYQLSRHAISFYEHQGYRIIGTADTLKYKEVMMEKSL